MKLNNFEFIEIKNLSNETLVGQAMEIYLSNKEFFTLLAEDDGEIETFDKNIILKDLESIPDSFSRKNKFYGIIKDKNNKTLALLDFLLNYPNSTSVYIGLLAINGKLHRKGIGSKIFYDFQEKVLSMGCNEIELAVLTSNPKAYKFWTSLGFTKKSRTDSFVIMNKLL